MAVLKNKEDLKISKELKAYFQNKFSSEGIKTILSEEDNCSKFWEKHLQTDDWSAFQILKTFYPQLHFPVQAEINKTEEYINAVLQGKDSYKNLSEHLQLNDPQGLKIKIHSSIAGTIPVVSINNNEDFVTIVQTIFHKNNPVPVPESMGAFLANGINNWARIHALKEQWIKTNSHGNWNDEFSKNILPNPDLYKDKIIVLSTKPYSNVPGDELGLSSEEWKTYSYTIRLEHECTHLYTLKRYGSASNNLNDELIADYIGISKAFGRYNKEWMLTFMGLEDYPQYRKGARLENYLKDSQISEDDFQKLTSLIKNAIETIEGFDNELGIIQSDKDKINRIEALCETGIIDIASKRGNYILMSKYNEKK
ncbi:hypothetical protein J3D55_004297 [Chryseobacterium ginsenosidimutans]|uniref:DUF7005 family protein n=1 Tax=Chryseobacterium ginsenosidimutans TaxID=687846 RepID=UPI002169A760|nr:hypothetical protein [Chryseobacterium ginsenosidimutans]MCS3871381.1 hypothetical protein [Chryseobacterium ginsenosidimutans]